MVDLYQCTTQEAFMADQAQAAVHPHVLVVPAVPEGHVNSLLRFAILLAHKGLLVSFGYPARPHSLALKRNKLSALPPSLHVHVIDDGYPLAEHEQPTSRHFEGSLGLIYDGIETILQHYVAKPDVQALGNNDALSSLQFSTSPTWPPICCIITDTFVRGSQDLANKFGIPRVDFWTGNATIYDMVVHLPEITARGLLPLPEGVGDKWIVDAPLVDFIPGLPAFHLTELPRELLEATDVSNFRFQFMLKAFAGAKDAEKILVHSLYELESHVYESMQAQGFPIYPVGPLLNDATSNSAVCQSDQCLEWLDQQDPASVVYVAFGTIAKLSLQEMHSLALGLEASGQHFLWVIQMKSLPASSLHESLPEEFIERTVSQGRGIIVTWAPQMEVLKHVAVGAFISHCGWNSMLESVWEGVPMVACPRAADQRCNARHIVKVWKFGVEMEREEDGTFTTEAVRKAIEEVIGNQEVKERALHFKQVARGTFAHGPSHSNIFSFVDYLFHLPVPGSKCS